MSIFGNIFGGGNANSGGESAQQQAPAQESQTQQPQQVQQPQQSQQASGDGATIPGREQQQSQQQQQPVSPLDDFSNLWETAKDENGNEITPSDSNFDPSQMFNIDPQKMQQAVSQIDFSKSIGPETLQQISEGGEGAQQAFAQAMNSVAQQAFMQSLMGSAKLVEQAMGKANESLDSRINSQLRQSQVQQSVRESNPAFKHPAAQPMVQALEAQFAQKYPQSSPQEISKMANDYFSKFADAIQAPEKQKQEEQSQAMNMDWESWMTH